MVSFIEMLLDVASRCDGLDGQLLLSVTLLAQIIDLLQELAFVGEGLFCFLLGLGHLGADSVSVSGFGAEHLWEELSVFSNFLELVEEIFLELDGRPELGDVVVPELRRLLLSFLDLGLQVDHLRFELFALAESLVFV